MEDVRLTMVFISGHPDPPALARDIAKRNGFHSLGPLLKYVCHAVKHITPTYHNISPLLKYVYCQTYHPSNPHSRNPPTCQYLPFLLYSHFSNTSSLYSPTHIMRKFEGFNKFDLKIYPWLLLTSWFLRFPRPVYKFCSFPNLLPPWICYYSNICFNKLKLSTTTPLAFPAPKAFFGFRKIRKMIEIWEKDPDLDQEN